MDSALLQLVFVTNLKIHNKSRLNLNSIHMKKEVLLNKLNYYKKSLLIFLLICCTCYVSLAQDRQVTGRVTSSDNGTSLPGVSIKIKGSTVGVISDNSGSFKIAVPNNATLVFSYIGYVQQELIPRGNVVNVKLAPSATALNEVSVVAIGYGTAKRTDLTGAISSVSAATIAKAPVVTVDQALQGRAAGVQVTNNDASPGGNISVLIRGTGSLAPGANGPLYVVDGYPLNTGGINNINPSDIASIDVLKDASSTAIYGIRAANGVVIVTTKKGRKDGVQVSFDAYNAYQSKPKQYKLLNAQQFAALANQQEATDPTGQFHAFAAWKDPSSLTNADWQNAIYRSGLTQNYSLAVRGGSDKVQTATSVGYYDQKGIVLGSYFKRISLGLNMDYQPVKWLR